MPAPRPPQPPMITPEADRRINAVLLRYGAGMLSVMILSFYGTILTGRPHTPQYAYRVFVEVGSYALFLIAFAVGMSKLYQTRLDIGRGLVREKQWKPALLALAPLDGLTQRYWDRTGEAHFLLFQCYTALGERRKAEDARKFTLSRPGPWADRLKGAPQASVRISSLEQKPRPRAKGKRRRF